jgi:copper chaperone
VFHRDFIQRITLAGTGGLATATAESDYYKTVTYQVKGFTCVTCAVGLETLLRQQKAVIRVKASYPSGMVRIEFDPALITGKALRGFISEMGFRVVQEHGH